MNVQRFDFQLCRSTDTYIQSLSNYCLDSNRHHRLIKCVKQLDYVIEVSKKSLVN